MFIEALFTIAKMWKQSRCPLTDKWITKMWYIMHSGILLSRKNEIMLFAGKWLDLEMIILNDVSQTKTSIR